MDTRLSSNPAVNWIKSSRISRRKDSKNITPDSSPECKEFPSKTCTYRITPAHFEHCARSAFIFMCLDGLMASRSLPPSVVIFSSRDTLKYIEISILQARLSYVCCQHDKHNQRVTIAEERAVFDKHKLSANVVQVVVGK